jgi:hypothetical protein
MGIFLRILIATAMTRLLPGWLAGIALAICCVPAGAIDLAAIGQLRQRDQATADVESARQAVTAARDKTDAARKRLDDFLANHFDLSEKAAAQPAAPQALTSNAESPTTVDPDAESIRAQLEDLRAERSRLLVTLTEAHPEVVDVDGRIASAESRLQAIQGAESAELPAPSDTPATSGTSPIEGRQRSQADAEEFRRLFSDWQACEQELEQARDAETKAIERLAALPVVAPIAEKPTEPTSATPASQTPSASIVIDDRGQQSVVTPSSAEGSPATSSAGSQTLALAALAIALAISALAAVKLSRAGSDPLFASADDVAAALAVPVVGIVPAAAAGNRAADPAALRRTVVVGLQILVAVTVFLAVAYLVQHIEDLTRFCGSPITAIRGWFDL